MNSPESVLKWKARHGIRQFRYDEQALVDLPARFRDDRESGRKAGSPEEAAMARLLWVLATSLVCPKCGAKSEPCKNARAEYEIVFWGLANVDAFRVHRVKRDAYDRIKYAYEAASW